MRATYDPVGGLVLSFPPYEWEVSIRLLRHVIRLLENNEQETEAFVALMKTILEHKERIQ